MAKLREQLKLMDSEYDSCQSVQVYGEINNWNAESLACIYFVIAFQVTQTILCVAPRFVQKATKAMNKATETSGAYIEYTFAASWPHHVHQKVLYIHVPICRCSKAVGLEMKIRSSPKSSAKKYEKKDPGSEKAKEKKEKKDKKRDKKEKTGKAKADGTEGEGATSSASRPKRLRRMEA